MKLFKVSSREKDELGLCQYRGLSMQFIKQLAERILREKLASGVQLVTFLQDFETEGLSVQAGTTARVIGHLEDDQVSLNIPLVGTVIADARAVRAKDRADWDMNDVGFNIVHSHDMVKSENETFTAVVEKIQPSAVGKAFQGYYVMHAHSTKFYDLVACLEEHFRGKNLRKVFVWLDVFGARQSCIIYENGNEQTHRQRAEIARQRKQFLAGEQLTVMKRFAECIFHFPSLENPVPLSRAWCLWELYGVALHNAKLSVVFGDKAHSPEQFCKAFPSLKSTIEGISTLEHADTFFKTDKDFILAAVAMRGSPHVATKVQHLVWGWMIYLAEGFIDVVRQRGSKGKTAEHLVLLCKLYEIQTEALCHCEKWQQAAKKVKQLHHFIRKHGGEEIEPVKEILHSMTSITTPNAPFAHKDQNHETLRKVKSVRRQSSVTLSLKSRRSVGSLLGRTSLLWKRRSSAELELLEWASQSVQLAQMLFDEGQRLEDEGDQEGAYLSVQESVDVLRRMQARIQEEKVLEFDLSEIHPLLQKALTHLGDIQLRRKEFPESLKCYNEALDLEKGKSDGMTVAIAHALNKIAKVHLELNEPQLAAARAEESLDIIFIVGAPEINAVDVVGVRGVLGLAYLRQGRFDEALHQYEQSLESYVEQTGQHDEVVADVLHSIALVHATSGDFAKAVDSEVLSLHVWKAIHTEPCEKAGDSLAYIAFCLEKLGEFENALETCRLAIAVYSTNLGINHVKVGEVHYHTGGLFLARNKQRRALESYEKALHVFHAVGHPNAGLALNNMAVIFEKLGRLDEAFCATKEALKILEAEFGSSHPQTVQIRGKLHRVTRLRSRKLSERVV